MRNRKLFMFVVIMITVLLTCFACSESKTNIFKKETDVSEFDIRGIKLGMSTDEVKTISPKLECGQEQESSKPYLEYYCTYSDNDIEVKRILVEFAKNPYGKGAHSISYIIPKTQSLSEVKGKLLKKYGSPDLISETEQIFTACWGSCKNTTKGKFLHVNVLNDGVYISLIDNTPRLLYEKELLEKKKPVNF